MRLIILILIGSIACSHVLRAQQKNKKSYPAKISKIENIKASYSGCTLGPCYSWWSKDANELLMQSGGHYPAAKSRYFSIGTWQVSGDTLKLTIEKEFYNAEYMSNLYRIGNALDFEILLPLDSSKNWDDFLKEIKTEFEQTDNYKDLMQYNPPKEAISKLFSDFVRWEYSTENKLLVSKTKFY